MQFPWRKKILPQLGYKMASWMVSLNALRQMQVGYQSLATEGYGVNPIVRACVEKIATSVSSVDLVLYKRTKGGEIEKVEQSNDLTKLIIDRPNPRVSGRQFLENLVRYRLIGGNAFVLGTGMEKNPNRPPKELYLLNPQYMTVIENPGGQFPKAYRYKPTADKAIDYPVDQVTGASAILHSKQYSPTDEWNGLSPMTAAASLIDVFNEGQKWNAKLLQNDCRPAGALMIKGKDGTSQNLTTEQRHSLTEVINDLFSGASNAGKPLILEGGLEWTQMSLNAKDMDHKENMLNAARFIASVYGVPPMLINIPGDATFANYEQARMALWTDRVLPLLATICDELNGWLLPLYGKDMFLWYDEEMIPALEPLRKEKAERINGASYLTLNEKRAAMGEDDVDGGDVIFVPTTSVPLDLAISPELPEPGSPSDTVPANN